MKILLHICCGPCAVYSIKRLRENGNTVEGFFYNPNIHPASEYSSRRDSVQKISETLDINIEFHREFQFEDFFRKISLHEQDNRCMLCWELRLNKTAEYASKNGFNGFTSTLFISPYQDHEQMRKIAQSAAERHSVIFSYEDFRSGFRESHQASKQLGLYHQKYCGCIYSEREQLEKVHSFGKR